MIISALKWLLGLLATNEQPTKQPTEKYFPKFSQNTERFPKTSVYLRKDKKMKYSSYRIKALALRFAHSIYQDQGAEKGLKSGIGWGEAQKLGWAKAKAQVAACKAMEAGVVLITYQTVGSAKKPSQVVSRYATACASLIPMPEAAYFIDGTRFAGKTTLYYQFEEADNSAGVRCYKPENFLRFEVASAKVTGMGLEIEPSDSELEGLEMKWETIYFNKAV